MTALRVFIGYDPRNDEDYRVCRYSMERRSSRDLYITALDERALRAVGLYTREWGEIDGSRSRIDTKDYKPFSTSCSFTRFLVPSLSLYQGWSLYCDSDLLFMSDLEMLFDLADTDYAVMVVKHEHEPIARHKMDGAVQTRYFRKNWSSLILWHNEHPAHARLTPWHVNNFPGSWLHAFSWLDDSEIGEVPLTWNWLSGVSEPFTGTVIPAAIHYTLGTPNMPGCED